LKNNPEVKSVDIWDDTFNITEDWAISICDYMKALNQKVGREIIYTCFLRPKGLSKKLIKKMREANIKVTYVGADALTEHLSKRLRRGCTVSELNKSIETLSKERIQPMLSVQLFSPESTVDDVGITATLALSCIRNGKSTVHLHLYTFPLVGSDMYRLLETRNNLKKIPSPLLKKVRHNGFEPFLMAYDYANYDPDLEEIKRKTYALLDVSASFFVRTYPGDKVDGNKLKEILKAVREWSIKAKKTHNIKAFWYMITLLLEGKGDGLNKKELTDLLSQNEADHQIPENLRKVYGNFGYRYTLSRSFDEVIDILIKNRWVKKSNKSNFRLTSEGLIKLKSIVKEADSRHFNIAAYGKVSNTELLKILARIPSK
jgi:hypothetical protein